MKATTFLGIGATISAAASLQAATVFVGSSLDLDASSGSSTVDGITVNLSANTGTINATASGLGINSPGTGDDTDGLDTELGTEILTLSFDSDITFESISLAGVGPNDALELSFNGGAPIVLASSGLNTLNQPLAAGQLLTITAIAPNAPTQNNGVNISEFVVVPEPSSAALALLGLAGFCARRRR